jgi:excisionase family DNA binding protein
MRQYLSTGTLRRAGGETLNMASSPSGRPTDPRVGPSLDGLPNPELADACYPKVTVLPPALALGVRPDAAPHRASPFRRTATARVIAIGVAQVSTNVGEGTDTRREPARDDEWMTVKEAARYARCHTETIRRAYWARQLRRTSFGVRSVRIRLSDLVAWLEGGAKTRP